MHTIYPPTNLQKKTTTRKHLSNARDMYTLYQRHEMQSYSIPGSRFLGCIRRLAIRSMLYYTHFSLPSLQPHSRFDPSIHSV